MATVAQQLRESQISLRKRLDSGVNKSVRNSQKSLAARLGSISTKFSGMDAIETADTLGLVDAPTVRRRGYATR